MKASAAPNATVSLSAASPTVARSRCARATSTKAIYRSKPATSFDRDRAAELFHALVPNLPPFLFSSIVGKPGINKKSPGTLLAVARLSCAERSHWGDS
jgi:hypothetical protein